MKDHIVDNASVSDEAEGGAKSRERAPKIVVDSSNARSVVVAVDAELGIEVGPGVAGSERDGY